MLVIIKWWPVNLNNCLLLDLFGHLQIVKEGLGCIADENSPAVAVNKAVST